MPPTLLKLASGLGDLSISYPKSLHIVTRPISKDPYFAAALATFPTASSGGLCAGFPVRAVTQANRPGSTDVFVDIDVVPWGFGPRPPRFDATTGERELERPPGCRYLPNGGFDQSIGFEDHDARVLVQIAFGTGAPSELRDDVYRAISSIDISYT